MYVVTNISEECIAAILSLQHKDESGTFRQNVTLKMVTICFSEMLVSSYKATRHHNPQDNNWYIQSPENLKYQTYLFCFLSIKVPVCLTDGRIKNIILFNQCLQKQYITRCAHVTRLSFYPSSASITYMASRDQQIFWAFENRILRRKFRCTSRK
jgi:hypothetical protein